MEEILRNPGIRACGTGKGKQQNGFSLEQSKIQKRYITKELLKEKAVWGYFYKLTLIGHVRAN